MVSKGDILRGLHWLLDCGWGHWLSSSYPNRSQGIAILCLLGYRSLCLVNSFGPLEPIHLQCPCLRHTCKYWQLESLNSLIHGEKNHDILRGMKVSLYFENIMICCQNITSWCKILGIFWKFWISFVHFKEKKQGIESKRVIHCYILIIFLVSWYSIISDKFLFSLLAIYSPTWYLQHWDIEEREVVGERLCFSRSLDKLILRQNLLCGGFENLLGWWQI